MHRAKDIMTEGVITVSPNQSVAQVIRTLLDNNISGAPVIDNGQLVGVVSEFQLLELIYHPELKTAPVSDFMTKEVLTVSEDSELTGIVDLFVLHRIRRMPVVRKGQLVGVISRRDVIRCVVEGKTSVERPPHPTPQPAHSN